MISSKIGQDLHDKVFENICNSCDNIPSKPFNCVINRQNVYPLTIFNIWAGLYAGEENINNK